MQDMEKKPSWTVYKDPLAKNGEILMGYKGDSYMDSGYFYAPYYPITKTPVVLDPNIFTPRKGILTRYGKKLLNQGKQFYGTMTIGKEPESKKTNPPRKNRSIFDPWEPSMES